VDRAIVIAIYFSHEDLSRPINSVNIFSRTNPYDPKNDQSKTVLRNIKNLGLDVVIAIGGEDTLGVAYKLSQEGVNVIGIPKTIDKDLPGTDYTLGFDTALNVIIEEVGYIVPEVNGTHSVYTRRKGIHQVVGVYRASDINKANNLYVGSGSVTEPNGQFNSYTGIITLSSNYSYRELEKVFYSYVHVEGLSDELLDTIFEYGKVFLKRHTGNLALNFSENSDAWWGALKIARIACLLVLSTGGVLQSGYNLGIEEFRLETKAWGEGMIAQFLWMQYQKEISEILAMFGCHSRFKKSSRAGIFTEGYTREMVL